MEKGATKPVNVWNSCVMLLLDAQTVSIVELYQLSNETKDLTPRNR